MTAKSERFTSSLSPEAVIEAFKQLAGEQGWKVMSESSSGVEAKQGPNLRTWTENIEVSVSASPQGTEVLVGVSTFQLFDWGEGSDLEREIKSRLGATAG